MVLFFITISSHAQTPAFPGALGFGAYVTGGRNGTVYHVTNLNDSGPGSFRDAVSQSGRTIVFDVGGEIKLNSAVGCANNLTIAGQTAPGGIKFDGGEVSFSGRTNIICRFIRVRPGSDTASDTDDCIAFANGRNMIFDHVSMEFGPWNNVGAVSSDWQNTPVTDVTFQHCIDADPTYQQFGAHTESINGYWTWCYNIFANSHNRNPLAKVNNVFINNIEYNNSAGYTTHTSASFKHDIVNNYFVSGPASGGGTSYPWFQVDNNQSIYCSGNYLDANKNGTLDGSITNIYWYQGGGTVLSSPWSSWTSIIPTMPTALAWRYGISAAGAFPRDDVDSLVISQMKTLGSGTVGTGVGTTGPDSSLYTSQTQTGLSNNGYGTLIGGTAPANFSGDGIADYWKLANNLNTNISYPLTNTADGYTLLEHYLNFLAAPHAVTRTNTPVTINLRQFTDGFSSTAPFGLSDASNGSVSLVNGTNAVFTPTANFSGLGAFNFTVTEGSYSISAAVTVCVTPVMPPVSAASFNGALIGVTITVAPPANLLWRGDGTANVWDLTVSNWLNMGSPSAFNDDDEVTFDDTGSNAPPIFLNTSVSPGAMEVNANNDYIITGPGAIAGSFTLYKSGSGTLTMDTANTYSGGTIISGGTLVMDNANAVGPGAITLSDGTLSLPPGDMLIPISISGSGMLVAYGFANTTLKGDVTGSGTWNINVPAIRTLTQESSSTGFAGTIALTGSGTYRINPTASLWGNSNAVYDLGASGIFNNRAPISTNIYLGALTGGSGSQLRGSDQYGSYTDTVLVGYLNLNSTFNGVIRDGTATSPHQLALAKVGSGTLTLTGNNSYSGGTTVSDGTLCVNNTAGSATGTGNLEVMTGATLSGDGIIGNATTIDNGATLAPGSPFGKLTISNSLTLNNSSLLFFGLGTNSDAVAVSGDLVLAGQLTITNSGEFGPDSYTLFTYGGTLAPGTFQLVSAPSNYNYSLDTNTPGQVKLVVSNPQPYLSTISLSVGNLILAGSGGTFNGAFHVLTSTNLALPLTNWTPLLTNQFDAGGNFNVTNALDSNSPQSFYLLKLP